MVGKLAGLVNIAAGSPELGFNIPELDGRFKIISVTLQDCVFHVAWFSMWMKCPLCSIWTIRYPGLHFKSHFPSCFILEMHMISNLKCWVVPCQSLLGSCESILIKGFLSVASASLCVSRCSLPESGSPRKCCMGSRS